MSKSRNGVIVDAEIAAAFADHRAGRRAAAEAVCRRRLAADGADHAALHLLAVMAFDQGRPGVSAKLAALAVAAAPGVAAYRVARGAALGAVGRLAESAVELRRAVELEPGLAEAWHGLGTATGRLGDVGTASSAYREAARLHAAALTRGGGDPGRRGRLSATCEDWLAACHEALDVAGMAEARRAAVRAAPHDPAVHSDLLYTLHYSDAYSSAAVAAEHRAWAARHANPLASAAAPSVRSPDAVRPIHVGYLSAGFCAHPTARFQEAALRHRDRAAGPVTCYASVDRPDAVTSRLTALVDRWVDVRRAGDADVAAMIRADGVDVLVDLDGHATGNRLGVLARRPAPVSATYNGYMNTTGTGAVDWRVTDDLHDPPTVGDDLYAERLYRLPGGCWCYTPDGPAVGPDAPPVADPPFARNGFVTFGSLNKLIKANPSVLRAWAAVLAAVPGSRLLLMGPGGPEAHDHLRRVFAGHGLDPARVDLVGRSSRAEYLRRFGEIDIALDPFPFNGITTTCDGLWQGVPLVTLAGDRFAARAGLGLLTAVGLGDLVAADVDGYVRLAANLAGDPGRLAELRRTLRPRMAASPLCDGPGFARRWEAALRDMWRRWCAGRA